MSEALKDKPDIPFRIPKGVRLVKVNPTTGKPQQSGAVITEAFKTTDADMPSNNVIGGQEMIEEKDESMPEMGGLY